MKKLLKIKYSILLAMLVFITSCETEDYTNNSTLVPTKPTIAVSGIPATINFVEKDSTFTFDVTLSVAQVVDISVYAKQASGDATEGEDFKILNDVGRLTITAGSTTGQIKVKVLADDVFEGTETFTIQIGDERTANATLTPVSVEFTILNTTSNELSVDMSWATDVMDAIGVDMDPEDVVDMRLLIVDDAGDIVDGADGAAFESWSDFHNLTDGVYRIAADIYATINAGDLNEDVNIDITIEFNQGGVINALTYTYPKVMTNANACDKYRTYLATVTKAGSVYTIVEEISTMEPLLVPWNGTDAIYWDSEVEIRENCTGASIKGINLGWMLNWWGEYVQDTNFIAATISGNAITIPLQYYATTKYNGALQTPYSIQGSGTINNSGAYPVWTIHYDLKQGDTWIGHLCYTDYGWDTDGFDAVITTDPAGKKVISQTVKPTKIKKPVVQ